MNECLDHKVSYENIIFLEKKKMKLICLSPCGKLEEEDAVTEFGSVE